MATASATSAVPVAKADGAPTYPRELSQYPNIIMHLGVGAFHRSHQAFYAHELLLTVFDPSNRGPQPFGKQRSSAMWSPSTVEVSSSSLLYL